MAAATHSSAGTCARGAMGAVCAAWTCTALAQLPEVGVAYRCDDGNEVRIASCARSICSLELGPPGRLEPYLRMAPEGAQTFLAAQHCVSPDGKAVTAPARPAPAVDEPLAARTRSPATPSLKSVAMRVIAGTLAVAVLAPLLRRALRGTARPIPPPAGGSAPRYAAPTEAAKPTCHSCSGRGKVACAQCHGQRGAWVGASGTHWQSCWSCGSIGTTTCSVCNGTGFAPY